VEKASEAISVVNSDLAFHSTSQINNPFDFLKFSVFGSSRERITSRIFNMPVTNKINLSKPNPIRCAGCPEFLVSSTTRDLFQVFLIPYATKQLS